jgi:solute carrier family 25 phosphate transporter 23/24/25/41
MAGQSSGQSGTPSRDRLKGLKIFAAGAAGGAVSRTATAPLDRMRMLLQVSDSKKLTLRQVSTLMASEPGGISAFFRGNLANVAKIAPENASKLMLYDAYKEALGKKQENISPLEKLAGGAVCGGVAQTSVYPLETARTRLAVSNAGTYNGVAHCLVSVTRNEGMKKLYAGVGPSVAGILPFAGVDMMVFEQLKSLLYDQYGHTSPPPYAILAAGVGSSSVAQLVSYPLYLVRTRLQADGLQGRSKYTGVLSVVTRTASEEGVLAFWKGLTPNLIKLAPAAGISWAVVEESKRALGVAPSRGI